MALKPITVSQVNDYISRTLAIDPILSQVRVVGEISGISYPRSGHVYFDLVDGNSSIRIFLPKTILPEIDFQIANGMEVIITGRVSVYVPYGSYSITVKNIEQSGMGEKQMAFLRRKEKLEKEGIFDPSHKKKLPFFPNKIGIVTSRTGAALQDILKNITLRNDYVEIYIFPVLVQGSGAAQDIANRIDFINKNYPDMDLLIVGRGGGSQENLDCFNEECIAYAIYRSEIPIIAAVGHEIDYGIADMAADVSAETPTKAGVIAVPDIRELKSNILSMKEDMLRELNQKISYAELRIEGMKEQLRFQAEDGINQRNSMLEKYKLTLDLRNPENVLKDGYAIVEDESGHIYSSSQSLQENREYILRFHDGKTKIIVKSTI